MCGVNPLFKYEPAFLIFQCSFTQSMLECRTCVYSHKKKKKKKNSFIYYISSQNTRSPLPASPINWGCRIHQLYLC